MFPHQHKHHVANSKSYVGGLMGVSGLEGVLLNFETPPEQCLRYQFLRIQASFLIPCHSLC